MHDGDAQPNHHLAAVMRQAGVSNKGLGRRVRELSETDGGSGPVRADHVQVSRWLAGRHPQPRTCRLIARALAEKLGRRVTLDEIGYGGVATGSDTGLEYPADVAASATALGQLAHNDLHDASVSGLTVVPDAWNTLLVRWLVDSDQGQFRPPASPRAVTVTDVDAIRDATIMFGNYDYKFGGGRTKLIIAKFLEVEILPYLPHIPSTDPVGREYFREVAALTRLAGWLDGIRRGRTRASAAVPDTSLPARQGCRRQGALRSDPCRDVPPGELPRALPTCRRSRDRSSPRCPRPHHAHHSGAVPGDEGTRSCIPWSGSGSHRCTACRRAPACPGRTGK
jgi:hypothetical protein